MRSFSTKPTDYTSYGELSKNGSAKRSMVPKGPDEAQFEAWLFREQR